MYKAVFHYDPEGCFKCGGPLTESQIEGYTYSCDDCDEDFTGNEEVFHSAVVAHPRKEQHG